MDNITAPTSAPEAVAAEGAHPEILGIEALSLLRDRRFMSMIRRGGKKQRSGTKGATGLSAGQRAARDAAAGRAPLSDKARIMESVREINALSASAQKPSATL